jgi:hypothetical protein
MNREAHRDLVRAVKDFEQLIAGQATKLAAFARARHQLDASIASVALRTDHVRFSHSRKLSVHPIRRHPQIIHRPVKQVDYRKDLGIRGIWGAGLELSTCRQLPGQ